MSFHHLLTTQFKATACCSRQPAHFKSFHQNSKYRFDLKSTPVQSMYLHKQNKAKCTSYCHVVHLALAFRSLVQTGTDHLVALELGIPTDSLGMSSVGIVPVIGSGSVPAAAHYSMAVMADKEKSKSKFLPSKFLVKRSEPISVSLPFGQNSCAIEVNATVGGWPSGSIVFPSPALSQSAEC